MIVVEFEQANTMPRAPLSKEDENVSLTIGLSLLLGTFNDLAAAFARIDRNAAEFTIDELEKGLAARLFEIKQEYAERTGQPGAGIHLLVPIAENMREAFKTARERMQAAGSPH